MTDPTKPLDAIERAQEETYFHKKDQELLEKLRTKLMREQAAEGIKAHTGVTDEALLARLTEIGITAETVPVLSADDGRAVEPPPPVLTRLKELAAN